MKHSQKQELAADNRALDLLQKHYKNVNGAVSFLEKQQKDNKVSKFLYYFSTHPHPENRLKQLQDKIKEKHYILNNPPQNAGTP